MKPTKKISAAQQKKKDEVLDALFFCLSDSSRRKILALLREAGEMKVGDIAEAFSMSLNGVSKHLKVLERSSLIQRRVEGREHWIQVHWETLQLPYEWLHFYRHFWGSRVDALIDYHKQQRKKK